ncbi:pa domain-containing protein [Diaporthe amygdali]|uniref:pa domain-containing protein n=1 Tax=Phomopsis amygdali TaxID=1214568 RepID=UPI0022FF2E00|nr:pa domain-containing protein [Diaporthe amygdali]KAJ0123433.1 pa domain-containing protein [Diaporthe amygdali]
MRPPRIAILVLFLAASLFLFCRSVISLRDANQSAAAPLSPHRTATPFRSFLSFTAPFTLFPPNAAISLTDDNSTFFPARPAAFGPPLPAKGLSGQLWIGSGFADENLPDGEGEGELGCSDLPGYGDGTAIIGLKSTTLGMSGKAKVGGAAGKDEKSKRSNLPKGPAVDPAAAIDIKEKDKTGPVDDGTDDYLHQSLASKAPGYEMTTVTSSHADIQSIQETAEITGKVVLLSRGGCGFLEKVKWAQRRGAVGVIVGDNQKGSPLIQMFARGDTSNVSIPAIFTSRTTAHLLSSLMQPGSFIEDIFDENGNPTLKVQQSDRLRKNKAKTQTTTAQEAAKPVVDSKTAKSRVTRKESAVATDDSLPKPPQSRSWMARWFGDDSAAKAAAEHSRPPSSGQHDWVLVDDWNDEKDKVIRSSLEKASKKDRAATPSAQKSSGDGFQIGVQDWRDPDLVDVTGTGADKNTARGKDGNINGKDVSGDSQASRGSGKASGKKSATPKDANGPKGGSITPGSGQYPPTSSSKDKQTQSSRSGKHQGSSSGLMSKLFGDDDGADFSPSNPVPKPINTPLTKEPQPKETIHEGLWVTITPTGSTAPFFDTLLVLVVSPLITLTVVYALLILRAKIRRRRWRAPKSVVERLPSSRSPSRASPPHEKESQWKKYMGRQVECVVCLEEYVDGVSRVMSLPCGHEFHAECITPWLTTRRRTCPICKGDVVRSLARGSPSSPRYEAYHDDSDEEDEAEPEASGSGRRSPAAQDADVEEGILSPTPRRTSRRTGRADGWLSLLSSSFGTNASASSSRSRIPDEDRDR